MFYKKNSISLVIYAKKVHLHHRQTMPRILLPSGNDASTQWKARFHPSETMLPLIRSKTGVNDDDNENLIFNL